MYFLILFFLFVRCNRFLIRLSHLEHLNYRTERPRINLVRTLFVGVRIVNFVVPLPKLITLRTIDIWLRELNRVINFLEFDRELLRFCHLWRGMTTYLLDLLLMLRR